MWPIGRLSTSTLRRIQAAAVGVIVGSIWTVLIRMWDQLARIRWQFNGYYLLVSMLLVVVTIWVWAWVWAWMLRQLGQEQVPLRQMAGVYIYSNAAKYVPGSIWNYIARSYLGSRQGLATHRIWVAIFVEIACAVFTGLSLYGISLFWPHSHAPLLPLRATLISAAAVLCSILPPVLGKLVKLVPSLWQANGFQPHSIRLTWVTQISFALMSLLVWTVVGTAFFFLIQSVYPLPRSTLPETIGIWSFSVVISLLAIGIPQGIGVKEGILVIMLSALMPLPVAITISIISRAWTVICELVSVVVWWLSENMLVSLSVMLHKGFSKS